jgi:hypothetical protein
MSCNGAQTAQKRLRRCVTRERESPAGALQAGLETPLSEAAWAFRHPSPHSRQRGRLVIQDICHPLPHSYHIRRQAHMAPGQPFRPHMHAQPQPQQQQKYQAYVMGPNGRYVGMQQQQLAQQQQQPPPLPPPQHRQRDPLTAAIRGTTVDHTDLKDAITHINLTRKEETDAKFLRHALQSLPQLDGVSPSQLDRIISGTETPATFSLCSRAAGCSSAAPI